MLSRREFAKYASISAATLSLGAAISACAGCVNSNQSASGTAEANGEGETGSNAATSAKGANSAQNDGSANRQVIISMPQTSEPDAGFNPLVAWGCGEHVHEPLIQSTLITTDANLEFTGDLATEYSCSDDGMTWTFTIRDDVVFSDGAALSAHDVAFTINGIKTTDAAQADLSSVKEAVAENDTTLVLYMNKPNNALLYTLAVVGIVPEHAYGPDYGTSPIGSGRYVLEQWDKGQQVILRANPLYYGSAPQIERVVVLFMSEDASLAAALAGQVDVAYTSAVLANNTMAGYSLFSCESVDSRGISLPCVSPGSTTKSSDGTGYEVGNEVTCDLSLRRAMNMGIDRQRMIDNVLEGHGKKAYSVGDGMPWSSDDMHIDTNVEGARAILAEGGWSEGTDGVLEKNDVRASFDLYYATGDSLRQALAFDFVSQMSELGIEVNAKGASWDDIYPHEFSTPILWGWGSNSPVELYELTHSGGWGNFACYENAEVDAALDEALAQTNIEDSYDFYKRAQWNEETNTGVAPKGASTWIWLANIDHLYFCREGLHIAQQKPHPHGHGWSLVNNIDTWSWE